MIELKITCESAEEARIYLNATQYLNLITDLYESLKKSRKHGTDEDVLNVVDNYMGDLSAAVDHSQGAY
jgi:hypothetical protein